MPGKIETRLDELGLVLPEAPGAAANYLPFIRAGDMLYVSGQISANAGGLITGRLGETLDKQEGAEAARHCALSLIAQVSAACDGDLDRVAQVVKLTGFVNSTPEFSDQPEVINGASDLMVAVFGEAGRHSRSAVGVSALPRGVAVEIDGVFQLR